MLLALLSGTCVDGVADDGVDGDMSGDGSGDGDGDGDGDDVSDIFTSSEPPRMACLRLALLLRVTVCSASSRIAGGARRGALVVAVNTGIDVVDVMVSGRPVSDSVSVSVSLPLSYSYAGV